MWDDWGNKIEFWTAVKQIADQAVGRVVSLSLPESIRSSLSSSPVSWPHICGAWADQRASHDLRKAWIQQSSNNLVGEDQQDKVQDGGRDRQADDVVDAVKHDPYLDAHEQRLLGCIIDAGEFASAKLIAPSWPLLKMSAGSMPTSFAHVHLPAHTIDSVRTIVSLPLLHPTAFQQGILKEHSMTGCLLFGPPGTGKTLVVRALAKEAGCRMLAISPSDVMDMVCSFFCDYALNYALLTAGLFFSFFRKVRGGGRETGSLRVLVGEKASPLRRIHRRDRCPLWCSVIFARYWKRVRASWRHHRIHAGNGRPEDVQHGQRHRHRRDQPAVRSRRRRLKAAPSEASGGPARRERT
jgi:hypothetical protein